MPALLGRAGTAMGSAWIKIPGFQKVFLLFSLLFLAGYAAIPLPSPLFPDDYSLVVLDAQGEMLRVFLNQQEQWCLAPEPGQPIPRKLKQAVLYYEDRAFYYHPGVNPRALLRAVRLNSQYGRIKSGASTITMQVARLLHPKDRTLLNKLLEILQALKIERQYRKETILRLYLDHAPYGGNIQGYQAAAWKYFGKNAKALTWAEAATLAVLPNAPSLVTPVANPQRLIEKRNGLLRRLCQAGCLDAAALQIALAEPAPHGIRSLPFLAPHAAQALAAAHPHAHTLRTTLSRPLQERAKAILQRHAGFLQASGVRNCAALIAETQSGAVRVYLGSQDFRDDNAKGKVDGVQAPRSCGSVLKPFLYALCLDEGLILPDMLLKDVPTYYREFAPQNYDKEFHGVVPAAEALIRSLNVPAVRLLEEYGLQRFYLFLSQAGLTTLIRRPDDYGLALILGGAEATLWDMAMFFRGLGRLGQFSGLHLRPEDAPHSRRGRQLIRPGSAYLTLEILKNLRRPGAEFYWELFQNQYPLAWKTGTSYGNRDAWAIGVSPEWVVAVWAGNFTGEPNPELSGARSAGPLLFDLFNALPKKQRQAWFSRPQKDLAEAEVCLDTGFIASPLCPHRRRTDIARIEKHVRVCPYHQLQHFSADRKNTVCSLCWKPGEHTSEVCLVYPPSVQQFLRQHGQPVTQLPLHTPTCPAGGHARIMDVVYPQEGIRLWIPRGFEGTPQRIIGEATHRDRDVRVFWYVDGQYLGETRERHDKAMLLETGLHVLQVVDENGNRVTRHFQTAVKSSD